MKRQVKSLLEIAVDAIVAQDSVDSSLLEILPRELQSLLKGKLIYRTMALLRRKAEKELTLSLSQIAVGIRRR